MKLQDYLDISQTSDKLSFEKLLVKFAAALDFGIATAAVAIDRFDTPGGPIEIMGNLPADYLAEAPQFQYPGRDPVLERLKYSSTPFCYDQSLYVDKGVADLWDFQAPFGFRTGITVAVHPAPGKHFLLGFDRHRPLPTNDARLVLLLASLQLLATFAQDAAFRLCPGPATARIDVAPKLTRRELEVLRWTLGGKTAWEIGQILAISDNTVLFHLKTSMRKFGVNSKHQAALKAVSLGLLKL